MKYPIYIPTKGRAEVATTPHLFEHTHLVVEPHEADAYRENFPNHTVRVLPWRDRGLAPSRQWIKEHAEAPFHWMLDDNIRSIHRVNKNTLHAIDAAEALAYCEHFVDRYSNIDIASLRHTNWSKYETKPFTTNVQVYCCMLIRTDAPYRWRGPIAMDTDYSLQVLASGRCTLRFNAFAMQKASTMTVEGGLTDFYEADGKIKQARTMQRRWPHAVKITRRHGVPRMQVGHIWQHYRTPLEKK